MFEVEQNSAAALRNATAAESFAASAEAINKEIGEAVGQLKAQAEEIEKSRTSSQEDSAKALTTATNNARSDLRAYLITTLYQGEIRECGALMAFRCVDFKYTNVGRTPAVDIKVTAILALDEPMGGFAVEEGIFKRQGLANIAD